MGRATGMKSPSFNLSRVSSMKSPNFGLRRVSSSHVRVRSQPIELETTFDFIDKKGHHHDQINQFDYNEVDSAGEVVGKKIMVVVDSSPAAKCALEWTLSHSVQNQDTIVLLYVTKSSKQGKKKSQRKTSPRVYELLRSMKKLCFMKRPEVQVEIAVVEAGKMKGPIIVEEVKKQGVTLLVLGKRKRSMIWHAVMRWKRKRNGGGIVEYCIENASCMTVAVRKKGKIGGYLITTRRHKDFWLLA